MEQVSAKSITQAHEAVKWYFRIHPDCESVEIVEIWRMVPPKIFTGMPPLFYGSLFHAYQDIFRLVPIVDNPGESVVTRSALDVEPNTDGF